MTVKACPRCKGDGFVAVRVPSCGCREAMCPHVSVLFPEGVSVDSKPGIYQKFWVRRTDRSSRAGKKHEHCEYFVLDLNHDKFAGQALLAYADACESEYPELAKDLRAMAIKKE